METKQDPGIVADGFEGHAACYFMSLSDHHSYYALATTVMGSNCFPARASAYSLLIMPTWDSIL